MNYHIELLDRQFDEFRLSDALMNIYKLFRDEFSSWYLEIVKPEYGKPIDEQTYNATVDYFEKLIKLLHPFMPFITEEIWQLLKERKYGESIMIEQLPEKHGYDNYLLEKFEQTKDIISKIRQIRQDKNIPNKKTLQLKVKLIDGEYDNKFDAILVKLAFVSQVELINDKVDNAASFVIKNAEYFLPLAGSINVEAEIEKLKKDLDYAKGFLQNVMKKLNNERFVNNAPKNVVERELQKKKDAEAKITALEQQLKELRKQK